MEVAERELVVILGQNGAGKATLLNCVLGLVKPDRGKILADGQDILAKPGLARRQIAVVFEEASNIYGYMTGGSVKRCVLCHQAATSWEASTPSTYRTPA